MNGVGVDQRFFVAACFVPFLVSLTSRVVFGPLYCFGHLPALSVDLVHWAELSDWGSKLFLKRFFDLINLVKFNICS